MHRLIFLIAVLAVLVSACALSEKPVVEENGNNLPVQSAENSPSPKVACVEDSDCGERRVENAYCFQGQPTGDIYDWKCENAGTPDAKCVQAAKKGVIEICSDSEFCRKGECVEYADCNDTDGGKEYDVAGKVLTNDLDVHEDYCKKGDTLIEYYCASDDRALAEAYYCDCENGACID